MKTVSAAFILIVTASFVLFADDAAKKVDLQKALVFAKGEKYQIDSNAKWSIGGGERERKESGTMRFVLANTIVAVDANNEPSEYTIHPIKASVAVDGMKAEEEDFKDGDNDLRLVKKEDRWELWSDKRSEREPLCWLALGQSPDFARMFFPAKPVRAGETWDPDLKAIENYLTTLFDLKPTKENNLLRSAEWDPDLKAIENYLTTLFDLKPTKENNLLRSADLKTSTWKGTGKLAKIENGNATVEIALSGALKLDDDDMSDITISGKFTATIDLAKAMLSKLDVDFIADFKWKLSVHVEAQGTAVFEKVK